MKHVILSIYTTINIMYVTAYSYSTCMEQKSINKIALFG